MESAFPKPFCSLQQNKNKPTISRFVTELRIGKPNLEISIIKRGKNEIVDSAIVRSSAPCGSTWYVAKNLIGVEIKREIFHDAIAKARQSYPCTATMNIDPELREPILHFSGFIIREVEEALRRLEKDE